MTRLPAILMSILLASVLLCLPSALDASRNSDSKGAAALAVIPIGMESLQPGPNGQAFSIYASEEGVRSENSQVAGSQPDTRPDAKPRYFPPRLSFRVTATVLTAMADIRPAQFDSSTATPELISSLRFRLRINRGGLRTDRLEPVDAHFIGVPADVPYGERIYRVTFAPPEVPVTDRLALEVLSPDGELLCKFPVQ